MNRSGAKWTTAEMQAAIALARQGLSNAEIGARMGRTGSSVSNAISKFPEVQEARGKTAAEIKAAAEARKRVRDKANEARAASLRLVQRQADMERLRQNGPPIMGDEEARRKAGAYGCTLLLAAMVRYARRHHPASDLAKLA